MATADRPRRPKIGRIPITELRPEDAERLPRQGIRRRGDHVRCNRLPRRTRHHRRRPRPRTPRRWNPHRPHDPRCPRHRPLRSHRAGRPRRRLDVARRVVLRRLGELAARCTPEDRGRRRHRGDAARRRRAARPAGRGDRLPRRHPCRRTRPGHRPRPGRTPGRRRRPTHRRRGRGSPAHLAPDPLRHPAARRRTHPRRRRRLVRVLPPLRRCEEEPRRLLEERRLPHRGPPSARRRPDGLRRHLPAADPPHRHHRPQGAEQHAHARAARPRQPLGDRLPRRRARRDPPRPRNRGRLPRLRRDGEEHRYGGRAGLRTAVLPRPPLGRAAPGVVHAACRRLHRDRREPPEAVPGHLPDPVRHRPRGPGHRGRASPAPLDRLRHPDLPRRQPAHQAALVLGTRHPRDPRRAPRHRVPRRGVHPPGDDARARRSRIPAVVLVLHLAQHEGRDRGLLHGASPTRRATTCARTSS